MVKKVVHIVLGGLEGLSDHDAHIKRTPKPRCTICTGFEDTTKMRAPSRGTCQGDLAADQLLVALHSHSHSNSSTFASALDLFSKLQAASRSLPDDQLATHYSLFSVRISLLVSE